MAGIIDIVLGGWSPIADTWAYNSTDNPTGIINWSGANSKVSAGMRIRFNNGGNTIYGIVTAVTGSTMTFLHEMNEANNNAVHLMANSAITNVHISAYKPLGFPVNPDRWSVAIINSTQLYRTTSVSSWGLIDVDLGNLEVPIGGWNLEYSATPYAEKASGNFSLDIALSTSTSSVSNTGFLRSISSFAPVFWDFLGHEEFVLLSTKTKFYIIGKSGGTSIGVNGNKSPTVIQATCAYL